MLAQRRLQLEAKRKMLDDNMVDVENVRRRLAEAVQRADDEDRWPAKMGEYTFTRKAQLVLAQTKQYVNDRQPLHKTYDDFFLKMDQMADTLRKDIGELKHCARRWNWTWIRSA